MGIIDALQFTPTRPTYLIQIDGSYSQGKFEEYFERVRSNPLYHYARQYRFDDVWPGMVGVEGKIILSPALANQMLDDFLEGQQDCEALLVHCARGKNRSPAVGLAFNRIFDFGLDHLALREKHPGYTLHVYQTLLDVAKQRGLGPGFDAEWEESIHDAARDHQMRSRF